MFQHTFAETFRCRRCRRCRRRRFISHLADQFVPWQQWTCVCFLCAMEMEVGRQVEAHFRLRQSCRQTRDSCALKQIQLEIRCSKDNYISYKMLQVVECASGGFQGFMFTLFVLACRTIVSWPTFGVEKHFSVFVILISYLVRMPTADWWLSFPNIINIVSINLRCNTFV